VVVSIDGNVVYIQDRSSIDNTTLAVNLESDVKNLTRGSHAVLRLQRLRDSAPTNLLMNSSLIYVFEDLQPTLIQVVAKPTINSIKLDNVDGNPGRFSIAAGSSVKYIEIDNQIIVQIQPESNLGAVLEFPTQMLLPFINIEGSEAEKIDFFIESFSSMFPAFTFTLPIHYSDGELETYRIIDIEIASIQPN
jgi:hypothetical protein